MANVNPLAWPKGVKLLCELCQQPALVQCTKCMVTYYCDTDHQKADWESIHEIICHLLVPLRTLPAFQCLSDEREHQRVQLQQRQKQLIEMTLSTAQLKLSKGNPGEALPAAIHCLRFSTELYGINTIESVPSYLLLAEVNLGLGRLMQAEEYLTQSQWVIMKNPECSHVLHQKLCRSYGLLCSIKGDLEEAIRYLANEVYFASEEFGCNSTAAAGGFYHMANVFSQQGKTDIADSFYTEVISIWHTVLSKMVKVYNAGVDSPNWRTSPTPDTEDISHQLDLFDEAQRAEASQILNSILDVQEKATKQEPDKICRTLHTLAMLHYLNTDLSKAQDLCSKALLVSHQVPNLDLTGHIESFMQQMQLKPS
ncbi:zinc finger MYND domain-containing protein 12 [Erpetoichthys calabaricus]|uniref:Zinc finger, MYND-type containing 12 n=1 Tax=Erpetoichthys calabaricus TaxID=27687 RepID=A0A8C4S4Z0_ERPCA|nr:zinc finger MYND domain-containing protein 12 [Erpetoichthys calabaricus]